MDITIPQTIPHGKHYTYTLAYPESMGGAVFYIGKGMGDRIYVHAQEAKKGVQSYKCNIIRKIWANGEQVVRKKLAHFATHEEAIMYEIALIFFMDGLANLTDGGDGTPGIIPSSQKRAKISKSLKNHPVSDYVRQRVSEARSGKPLSEEHRQKVIDAHWQSDPSVEAERRRKISETLRGRKLSEKAMANLRGRKGQPGREKSLDERRKISEGLKGHPVSEATRRKLSEKNKPKKGNIA